MSETNQTANPATQANCVCAGYGPKLSMLVELMMPSGEAGNHFRQAQLELLKGLRAVLDQRIEAMSEPKRQGTKLSVD